MTLYVENLPEVVTPSELSDLFARFDRVTSALVARHRDTGVGYGAGIVEMADGGAGAVRGLDGFAYRGQTLPVAQVLPTDVSAVTPA